ncbi:glycosyltransferase family 2 protein [Mediterraneibacter glycyrrhizinilyticus]|uniref:glycosyltransferase family 2 protein n=1 Tax=Mediterraneibacter glycyrrhizinilyticus TaxID=342942 RepID=UPI000340E9DE|nr:glycosyl transferase [Lachnospiraceae bacterium CAG:215]
MRKLSFVIPCYRSADSISQVVHEIIKTVESDARFEYEIICINDCSPDNTYQVLKQLSQENLKIKVIDLSRNFGQHSALMAGFNHVTGDIIVCLDDDGQNPPSEMFKLIDKLDEGYDLVSAKYSKKKHSLFRKIGTKISFAMSSYLVGKPKDIDLNSYYVFKRYVLDEVIKYDNPYPFVHGLILRVTRNMANVEIDHKERQSGSSGYNLKKLFGLWMNGFTAFSEKPLRIASIIGCICAGLGFLYGLIIIIRKLLNPEILVGYSSMMAVILFLCGMIMLFLGLLGEYIGRIYISINNAPQYAIRETINISEKEDK